LLQACRRYTELKFASIRTVSSWRIAFLTIAPKLNTTDKHLRQACHSYNFTVIASTVSAFINIVGAGLLFSEQASVGAGMTTGGMAASVQCV
jgi:hypothetical protein